MDILANPAIKNKTKYHRYLASRQWAILREAVRVRSCGTCERCRVGDHDATHHLTYESIYDECLDDLIGICQDCHDFLSGKSGGDPLTILHQDNGWGRMVSYLFSLCISKTEIDELWEMLCPKTYLT